MRTKNRLKEITTRLIDHDVKLYELYHEVKDLGEIAESLSGEFLPGNRIQISSYHPEIQDLKIFTDIQIFSQIILSNLLSGLSSPLNLYLKHPVKNGDILNFNYRLGAHPKLIYDIEKAIETA